MNIIDSFCFPVVKTSELSLLEELPVPLSQLPSSKAFKRFLCLFNQRVANCDDFLRDVSLCSQTGILGLIPANLSDADSWWDYQDQFSGFVLHPYLQNLEDIENLRQCAKRGVIKGRPVFVCTAIGSKKMYKIFPLNIANAAANLLESPVVLAHAGGAKVLEALLIADANPNVFLETSFSLHYWQGSSVESDLAFAIKKLGSHRCLYGSDAPFCSESDALAAHGQFFERYGFCEQSINQIMCGNAQMLMQ